jgi:hypothetical protein
VLLVIFVFLVAPLGSSQSAISVTVSTNKPQYSLGDTIIISGSVLDSQNNPVAAATVSIQIGDPPQRADIVYTGNSGGYQDTFTVPANMQPGEYVIYATASKSGSTSAPQQTHFTIVGTSTTSSQHSSSQSSGIGSPCFIATATYGSEVAPEVALLRHFRDAEVVQTFAGRSFMQAFNAFYYSFSPQVAAFISSNGGVRLAMKAILYPLIGILYLSAGMFGALSSIGELAVVTSGIFAAFGIGVVYFGPIAIISKRFVEGKARNVNWVVLGGCLTAIFGVAIGEATQSSAFLTAATVLTVLSFLLLGAFSFQHLVSLTAGARKSGKSAGGH